LLVLLAGGVAALTIVVIIGVAAVRWAHHVAAFVEIAAIVVAGLAVLAILSRRVLRGSVRRGTILELDLQENEARDGGPLAGGGIVRAERPTLQEVVETIERAGRDRRVVALLARIGGEARGLGQIQELREAVTAFQAAGKLAVAFSETFGEFAPGTGS
jgi:protease-4